MGTLLCDNCKYNITNEYISMCVACGRVAGPQGVCTRCRVPYQRGWCVGERVDELQKLVDGYKFRYQRSAHHPLADLLLACVAQLPENTVVVPIPTVSSHVRQRGYDHTYLIARDFARKRQLRLQMVIKRKTATTQRDANRATRIAQARRAFSVPREVDGNTPYLLIDDIITTGSTLKYAAKVLKAAGAKQIWVAAIARQSLD